MADLTILEIQEAVAETVAAALNRIPSIISTPARRLSETDAAKYLGRSSYWLRNLRLQDKVTAKYGYDPQGPTPHYDGRSPFYLKEDLDKWLDKFKESAPTGLEEGAHE